jgi:hypothetical protein
MCFIMGVDTTGWSPPTRMDDFYDITDPHVRALLDARYARGNAVRPYYWAHLLVNWIDVLDRLGPSCGVDAFMSPR